MRAALVAVAALFFALGALGAPDAHAVSLTKRLCDNSGNAGPANYKNGSWCAILSTAPNKQVDPADPYVPHFYVIELEGFTASDGAKTVHEEFPGQFSIDSIACHEPDAVAGGYSPVSVTNLTKPLPILAPVSGATSLEWDVQTTGTSATNHVICLVKGFFMNPFAASTTIASSTKNWAWVKGSEQQTSKDYDAALNDRPPVLDVKKSLILPSTNEVDISNGPATAAYRIEITSSKEIYLGSFVELVDSFALAPSSVPLAVKVVSGSGFPKCTSSTGTTDCLDPTPQFKSSNPLAVMGPAYIDHPIWRFPTSGPQILGHIDAGATITLEYQVEISTTCLDYVRSAQGNGLLNQAQLREVGAPGKLPPQAPSANLASVKVKTKADPNDPTDIDADYCLKVNPTAPPGPIVVTKQLSPTVPQTLPIDWTTTGSGTAIFDVTVKNTAATGGPTVFNIALEDSFTELPATPPFKAGVTNVSCVPAPLCGAYSKSGQNLPFIGYFDTKALWSHKIPKLAPQESVTFTIAIRLTQNNCVSATKLRPLNVRNQASASYSLDVLLSDGTPYPNYPYHSRGETLAEMSDLADCEFKTHKKVTGGPGGQNKIVFADLSSINSSSPFVRYRVSFKNEDSKARQIGTLIDAMTLQHGDYATQLNAKYRFKCEDDGTAAGQLPTVSNYVAVKPLTGPVLFSHQPNLPHGMGSNWIDFKKSGQTWAVFQPGAVLNCAVIVYVERPKSDNPYCMSAKQPSLVNMGLMDVSALYPPAVQWPGQSSPIPQFQNQGPAPYGTNWSARRSNLPKCFGLNLIKIAEPTFIAPGAIGGPVVYTVTVRDAFHPNSKLTGFSGSGSTWNGLVFTDNFKSDPANGVALPSGPATLKTDLLPEPCGQSTDPCDWFAPPGSQPARMFIKSLDNDQSSTPPAPADGTLEFQYALAPPYAPDAIVNTASVEMEGAGAEDWYAYDPAKTTATANVHVTGTLNISKIVDHGANPVVLSPTTAFSVSVDCKRDASTNLHYPGLPAIDPPAKTISISEAQSGVVQGIYVGSDCDVTETPDASILPQGCKWLDPVITPNGGKAVAVGDGAPGHAPSYVNVTIINSYKCDPVYNLSIVKTADDYSIDVGDTVAFTLVVTNDGASALATGAVVSVGDQLPAGLSPMFAQSNVDWDCSAWPPGCVYIGAPLGAKKSAVPITIVAKGDAPGTYENCAVLGVQNAALADNSGVKSCVSVVVAEPEDCCCEEDDCAFVIEGLGSQEFCISWHLIEMLCCFLTLLLLFLILLSVGRNLPWWLWIILLVLFMFVFFGLLMTLI